MWREYSRSFVKNNPASGRTVMAAAFISAMFLSLLCSLGFNFWTYEVETIVREEGDWQGRITGVTDENDLAVIGDFANVDRVVVNETLSEEALVVVDLYFKNRRAIYGELPLITEKLGLEDKAAVYHETLLSRYLIHDPQDENPPLLLSFYLILLLGVSGSLILIIHNSFAVSMNERIHQLGILSGIGATPGQIFMCLMLEAGRLCVFPLLAGCGVGTGLGFGIIQMINFFAKDLVGRQEAVFQYHPLVFGITVIVSVLTVLISAGLPAGKLSRMTPLEAMRGTGEVGWKRVRHHRILNFLFGVEGELAGNALKAQRKALRTAAVSFTLSFLGFTVMLCFFTLSGISTDHTYFERYQDAWDVMVTVKDTEIKDWKQGEAIRALPGVRSSVAYQKAEAFCVVPEGDISEELEELGMESVTGDSVIPGKEGYLVKAPIVIMDDSGFEDYCRQIGIVPETGGCVVLNRIWDSINSNFRSKEYIPFIKEQQGTVSLKNTAEAEQEVEIPVLGYTQKTPVLREEYDNYALVQILPLTVWGQIAGELEKAEDNLYIRILGTEGITEAELEELQSQISGMIPEEYTVETENRIQEKRTDDSMKRGMMVITGGFCVLLAVIGIANVFSNTLGFLRQRRREFARYMSVGMTPKSMKKMFFIEALILAGKPVLCTLPPTVLAVAFMIRASYLDPMEFLVRAPFVPIIVFILAVFVFVGLAYYIGGKRVLQYSLAETLKNDTML